jgi:hypothetical protein
VYRIKTNDPAFAPPASKGDVASALAGGQLATADQLDVSGDGRVSPFDALMVVNHLNQVSAGLPSASDSSDKSHLDVNGDARISASDALAIVNHLNAQVSVAVPAAEAEGEADEYFSNLGQTAGSSSDDLLSLLADDVTQRRKRRS